MRTLGISALVLAVVFAHREFRRGLRQRKADDEVERIAKSVEILQDLTVALDEGIPQVPARTCRGHRGHSESREGRVRGRRQARPRRRERARSRAERLVGASVPQDDRRQCRLADWRPVDGPGVARDEPAGCGRSARRQVHAGRQPFCLCRTGWPQRRRRHRHQGLEPDPRRTHVRRVCLPARRSRALACAPTAMPIGRFTAARSACAPSSAARM